MQSNSSGKMVIDEDAGLITIVSGGLGNGVFDKVVEFAVAARIVHPHQPLTQMLSVAVDLIIECGDVGIDKWPDRESGRGGQNKHGLDTLHEARARNSVSIMNGKGRNHRLQWTAHVWASRRFTHDP